MKFGKINSANLSSSAILLGGTVAGSAISGGLMTFVPAQQITLARSGAIGLGLLGAASVSKDKTTGGSVVQAICLGVALKQSLELVKTFAAKEIQVQEGMPQSQKFVAGMVGLACPCDDQPLALSAPTIDFGDITAAKPLELAAVPTGNVNSLF